jgi:hypothetical protein
LKDDRKALHGLWRRIVEDYNLLDLTYENDGLPALTGLASRFKEYLPEDNRYLAGLWESHLGRNLLWESEGASLTGEDLRRRLGPGLPSSGEVADSSMDWEKESKPEWAGTIMYDQDPCFHVIHASVQVDGVNPYGSVISGCLVLRGAIAAVVMFNASHSGSGQTTGQNSLFFTISHESFNTLHLNYDIVDVQRIIEKARDPEGRTVYCLFIGTLRRSIIRVVGVWA